MVPYPTLVPVDVFIVMSLFPRTFVESTFLAETAIGIAEIAIIAVRIAAAIVLLFKRNKVFFYGKKEKNGFF